MRHKKTQHTRKIGQPPGTLFHVGETYTDKAKLSVVRYSEEHWREQRGGKVDGLGLSRSEPGIAWINVCGVHDSDLIGALGTTFQIHPLVLEDVLNTDQRPKIEDYEDYLYIVLRAFRESEGGSELESEQISLIVGNGYVISFQEMETDQFQLVRDRIGNPKAKIRKEGADYLAYTLIDTLVDNYFLVLEALGERLEDLEEALVVEPSRDALQEIHDLKREMLYFRKALWPLREVIGALSRNDSGLVKPTTVIYIRDVYDHAVQAIDTLETYRDILSGILDIYLSSISNRMNQIMKVLTIISTVFIPLTFIAGLYGMNFKYMPELEWEWGYPAVLMLMLGVVLTMLVFFRRQKWL